MEGKCCSEEIWQQGRSKFLIPNDSPNAAGDEDSARDQTSFTADMETDDKEPITPKKSPRKQTGVISLYFSPSSKASKQARSPAGTVSIIQFPPLSNKTFGLIQEELAAEPFKLIVAVTLLNKTHGTVALPVLRQILAKWPTVESFAAATIQNLFPLIQPLGLHKRTPTLLAMARAWQYDPPVKGRRYRTLHYPYKQAGKDIKPAEVLTDDDPRVGAWEIAHVQGLGPYAWDSWRIFCRDKLRGVANGYNGEDAVDPTFEPEWKRVSPLDKELRAFLRWMWLEEGIFWDPETGEKLPSSEDLMKRAEGGEAELLAWEEEKAFLVSE